MTNRADDHIDENDVALLLPWYAAGTLERDERRRVEAFLAENPEQEEHLAAIAEELDATVALNRSLPAPSPGSLDAIFGQIRREEGRREVGPSSAPASRGSARGGWLTAIGGFLDGLSPAMRGAALAALMLLAVVQAGVIGTLVAPGADEPTFEVATGEATAPTAQADLLVTFAPGASLADVAALLDSVGARIVDGPRAGGVWGIDVVDDETADAVLEALEARADLVVFVVPGG